MANPKLKTESYQNLGGINAKMSPHELSPMEFIDIKNFDFQTPGALTQRWGSTQYNANNFPGQVNSIFEYGKLDGSSYVVASYSGGILYGATTGVFQGMSFASHGITYGVLGVTVGTGIYVDWSGGVGVLNGPLSVYYHDNPSILFEAGFATKYVKNPYLLNDNILSYVVFQNTMFMADGNKFVKFDGITTSPIGLPLPLPVVGAQGFTMFNAAFGTTVGVGNATLGSYCFYASYVNSRGYEGEPMPICQIDATRYNPTLITGTFFCGYVDLFTPKALDVSSVNVYSYFSGITLSLSASVWTLNYGFLANYPANSATTRIPIGGTLAQWSNMVTNALPLSNPALQQRQILGSTMIIGGTSGFRFVQEQDVIGFYPRYLEQFQNRIFASGFSSAPSDVYFSELAEPESYPLVNNFQVRTNDADVITASKAFTNKLMYFKKNSVHALFGDSPANFFLQELSTIYGALNNRCVVTFDNFLCFLDRKGVIHFNGSTFDVLSFKVQNYFDRMNYNVALNTAIMVHDKLRSQIMVAIPIDGATQNNITLVYDYLVKAWSTHTGYVPTSFATVQGYNNTKNLFYGSASGTIQWAGPSFCADNGAGFTASFKTRFIHDMGDSVEKQFRRLYINAVPQSATLVMPTNFYQDYGSSIVLSATFIMSTFQDRMEFGIPAKSLAFEIFNLQTSSPLKITGFTIESRLQRRV